LKQQKVKASFFLTGRFYRNPLFKETIRQLKNDGHYLGAHSDQHLLYCDWSKRDSLLVTKQQFLNDLLQNYSAMVHFGITKNKARFFLPPYEWYNDSISAWTKESGLQLINYTPGTLSHADYTTPEMTNYRGSEIIYKSILDHEKKSSSGLNGYVLLMHIGTDPGRTDKFYKLLPALLNWLKANHYQMIKIDELLKL
jgi:peptidoglycan/xylan/chitin deacetylase (PgdA/CDA1 family)